MSESTLLLSGVLLLDNIKQIAELAEHVLGSREFTFTSERSDGRTRRYPHRRLAPDLSPSRKAIETVRNRNGSASIWIYDTAGPWEFNTKLRSVPSDPKSPLIRNFELFEDHMAVSWYNKRGVRFAWTATVE